MLARDAGARVWQRCGSGVDVARALAPNLRLPDILGWLGDRIDAERKRGQTMDVRPDRRSLYSTRVRATRQGRERPLPLRTFVPPHHSLADYGR